ncbi:MAG: hypothetical protein L0Z54_01580, partial [Thermoplasmata archaeon]|nr:hypothetical protein [Thermoplasmata archaeon]
MRTSIIVMFVLSSFIVTWSLASAQDEVECPRGAAPTIDGTPTDREWADAGSVSFTIPIDDAECSVLFKHDGESLYIAFDVEHGHTTNVPDTRVMLDLDNDAAADPQDDDHELYINPDNGGTRERQGNGGGWDTVDETGWTGAWNDSASDAWSTEYSVSFGKLRSNGSGVLGVGFVVYGNWGSKAGWPDGADEDSPATWGNMTFESDAGPDRPRISLRGDDLLEVSPGSKAQSRLAVANGGEEAVTITLTVRGDISRWGSLSPSS